MKLLNLQALENIIEELDGGVSKPRRKRRFDMNDKLALVCIVVIVVLAVATLTNAIEYLEARP